MTPEIKAFLDGNWKMLRNLISTETLSNYTTLDYQLLEDTTVFLKSRKIREISPLSNLILQNQKQRGEEWIDLFIDDLALEEIPEILCDNKSDSIICYHSRKPGFSESDNGEPLTLCRLS